MKKISLAIVAFATFASFSLQVAGAAEKKKDPKADGKVVAVGCDKGHMTQLIYTETGNYLRTYTGKKFVDVVFSGSVQMRIVRPGDATTVTCK